LTIRANEKWKEYFHSSWTVQANKTILQAGLFSRQGMYHFLTEIRRDQHSTVINC
jgi:hypothetical protein